MGYETRIHVVEVNAYDQTSGIELASVDLRCCGDGVVWDLLTRNNKRANKSVIPPFALSARSPDRQAEAVEALRDFADMTETTSVRRQELLDLASAIDDGVITVDGYGDFLSVFTLDEFMAALETDLATEEYRRFRWALNLLATIKETCDKPAMIRVVAIGH